MSSTNANKKNQPTKMKRKPMKKFGIVGHMIYWPQAIAMTPVVLSIGIISAVSGIILDVMLAYQKWLTSKLCNI